MALRLEGPVAKGRDMLRKYKVGYTQDQLCYTPSCALDFKVPVRVVKDVLRKNADEVYPDDKLRYGQSRVVISEQGIIEIEEESPEDTARIMSLLKDKVDIKKA